MRRYVFSFLRGFVRGLMWAALPCLIWLNLVAFAHAQTSIRADAYLRLRQLFPPVIGDGPEAMAGREAIWREALTESRFIASHEQVGGGPDLSEYTTAMDALTAQHAATWRTLADRYPAASNGYSDPVRGAIDGLWMLARATKEPRYAALAVELTQRVIAASSTVPRHFTSDTRMFAGFRDVAQTARELGVDPGTIDQGVEVMLAYYTARSYCCVGGVAVPFREWALRQHLDPLRLTSPFAGGVQGQAMDGARMAPPGDPWREAVLDALAVAEASGTYAAGWNEGYRYRSTFKAFGDVAAQVITGRPAPPVWSKVYDGTRFSEFVDGTSRAGFHGASQLYEGACLLPEARALCRQAIAGTLTGTMRDLNDSTDGTRRAAATGATALGEVL